MAADKEKPNFKVVADNRRARYDYEIGETFEAGLMLTGPEVKSLRTGKATVAESYAAVDRNGEIMLYNANIPEYLQANRFNHEPKRPRKLLLHAKEIAKLAKGVEREGMTIVPLRIYFNAKGRAKIAIALGRGKKLEDIQKALGQVAEGVLNTRSTLDLARKLKVPVLIEPRSDGSYTVDHSGAIFVLDPQGELAAILTGPFTVDALRTDWQRIVAGRA